MKLYGIKNKGLKTNCIKKLKKKKPFFTYRDKGYKRFEIDSVKKTKRIYCLHFALIKTEAITNLVH